MGEFEVRYSPESTKVRAKDLKEGDLVVVYPRGGSERKFSFVAEGKKQTDQPGNNHIIGHGSGGKSLSIAENTQVKVSVRRI